MIGINATSGLIHWEAMKQTRRTWRTILCATILAAANSRATAQEMPDPPQAAGGESPSFLDNLADNLRANVDITVKIVVPVLGSFDLTAI